jgi:hypothetical protein
MDSQKEEMSSYTWEILRGKAEKALGMYLINGLAGWLFRKRGSSGISE